MCEPNHSIVQFPDQDPDGNPTGSKIDTLKSPEGVDSDFWSQMKKKVAEWYHFSLMGKGHSESIATLRPVGWGLNTPSYWKQYPTDTRYEARWWDRGFILDGRFNGLTHVRVTRSIRNP